MRQIRVPREPEKTHVCYNKCTARPNRCLRTPLWWCGRFAPSQNRQPCVWPKEWRTPAGQQSASMFCDSTTAYSK